MTETMLPIAHASRIQLLQARYRNLFGRDSYSDPRSKPVMVNGTRYASASEAASILDLSEQAIRNVCNGRRQVKMKGVICRWAGRNI